MYEWRMAIGGCRYFQDYSFLKLCLLNILSEKIKEYQITILSGHCVGIDQLAEQFAKEFSLKTELYPAEWHKYGKAAGAKRNQDLVKRSDLVIAFWDGKSKGTQNLIDTSQKQGKPIHIIDITQTRAE